MAKKFLVLTLLSMIAVGAFAQISFDNAASPAFNGVTSSIGTGIGFTGFDNLASMNLSAFSNQYDFEKLSDSLSSESIKRRNLAIGLNILPGFGVGSFVQGDNLGGLVLILAESMSYLWIIDGLGLIPGFSMTEDKYTALSVGAIMLAVSKILGVYCAYNPFLFGRFGGFGRRENVSVAFSPNIDMEGQMVLTTTVGLRY